MLIKVIQNKLSGEKTSMLSVSGRLTLLNVTLSLMFIFFMSTFMLLKWIIKEIDKIRRNFLWHGHKDQTQGIYESNSMRHNNQTKIHRRI
jgi:uncharacterized protein YqhQ